MQTGRVPLATPYGQFTPTAREVISFDMLRAVVGAYYGSVDEKGFLAELEDFARDFVCGNNGGNETVYEGVKRGGA